MDSVVMPRVGCRVDYRAAELGRVSVCYEFVLCGRCRLLDLKLPEQTCARRHRIGGHRWHDAGNRVAADRRIAFAGRLGLAVGAKKSLVKMESTHRAGPATWPPPRRSGARE